MGVRIYKISEYEHAAEIRQFDALCRILGELEMQTGGEYVLVGNYNIEGVELDALLFTPQAALVIEFKNWGGSIVAGENGTQAQIWQDVYGENQLWKLDPVPDRLLERTAEPPKPTRSAPKKAAAKTTRTQTGKKAAGKSARRGSKNK